MSDLFYQTIVTVGRLPFWASSRPLILHPDRVPRTGPFLLAANHLSPFDVPLLMRHTPRRLDFVSITEVFANPFMAWFYGSMNAFPLDRSRPDAKTTRILLDRLAKGRPVALFPEGRIRPLDKSALLGHPFPPNTARLARLAGVPILPVAVWNAGAYHRWQSWLPGSRIRYAVAYGPPIPAPITPADEPATHAALATAFRTLYAELQTHLTLSPPLNPS